MATALEERKTDIGPPHYQEFLPPIIKANYGTWKHHEILRTCLETPLILA